jgi:hypothetical protein
VLRRLWQAGTFSAQVFVGVFKAVYRIIIWTGQGRGSEPVRPKQPAGVSWTEKAYNLNIIPFHLDWNQPRVKPSRSQLASSGKSSESKTRLPFLFINGKGTMMVSSFIWKNRPCALTFRL